MVVGHNSYALYPKDAGVSLMTLGSRARNYSYREALQGRFYLHTSSLMFRRDSSGLPDAFEDSDLDGDTPFFLWHLLRAKGMTHYSSDISSVYRLVERGWWNKQNAEEQQRTNLALLRATRRSFVRPWNFMERKIFAERIKGEAKRRHVRILSAGPLFDMRDLEYLSQPLSGPPRGGGFRPSYSGPLWKRRLYFSPVLGPTIRLIKNKRQSAAL